MDLQNAKFKDLTPKLIPICWDVDVDPEQIARLLRGEIGQVGNIDRISLYRRLLMTYDWYTLLALIPPDRLREALSEAVLDRLYPASLKNRYLYARSILFG
jgi:hypothetical protein